MNITKSDKIFFIKIDHFLSANYKTDINTFIYNFCLSDTVSQRSQRSSTFLIALRKNIWLHLAWQTT